MVLTTDSGHSPRCQYCEGVIRNKESEGIAHTPEGNLAHTSCYRERFGYESLMESRDERWHRVNDWANFAHRGTNEHGARRVA